MSANNEAKQTLKFLADSVERYQVKRAHLTTCQTVQFHDLDAVAVCDIMEQVMEVGIVTRGGGGDFPRNTKVSPLSGVEQGEYFDVLPYAEHVSDYLMGIIKTRKLPRKLKVGFSNSPANVTHATFRDLGFVTTENGTFDVYSAGGLGNNYRMGVKVAENVRPEEVLYYVEAMVRTFLTYGNYESRAKSRTRYMQETLGTEGYKTAYQEKLEEVQQEFGSNLLIKDVQIDGQIKDTKSKETEMKELSAASRETKEETRENKYETVSTYPQSQSAAQRVIAQKQNGLYAVAYHPVGGMISPQKFGEFYEILKHIPDAELRIAPEETLYIINLPEQQLESVLTATADGARNLFETSVSCIGSTVCQIGLRDS